MDNTPAEPSIFNNGDPPSSWCTEPSDGAPGLLVTTYSLRFICTAAQPATCTRTDQAPSCD